MAGKSTDTLDKFAHGKLKDLIENSFRIANIDGKQVIQSLDGEFIEYTLMDEDYFVNNWLAQFAVGMTGKVNYFNQQLWAEYTQQFTKGVIVLNKEMNPTLIIRKFIDMDLSINQQHHMDHQARIASNAANIPNKEEVDQMLITMAQAVEAIAEQNPDYDTLTAMIPMDYYLEHGINPFAAKQAIWIRDNYTYKGEPLTGDSEVMEQISNILYRNAMNLPVTDEEKALISEITEDQFIFNSGPNTVEENVSQTQDTEAFNPLAD